MKTMRLPIGLSEIRRNRSRALRRDDALQQRIANYVARHSTERRLEAYTLGRERFVRKAATETPFNR
jgi:hypothetical protein